MSLDQVIVFRINDIQERTAVNTCNGTVIYICNLNVSQFEIRLHVKRMQNIAQSTRASSFRTTLISSSKMNRFKSVGLVMHLMHA